MEERDTKGDLYEYVLAKITTAGQNGDFRTPRHIIRLMVEMVAPKPRNILCDPACGTAGKRRRTHRQIPGRQGVTRESS
jgi:type I restriction enzyme M protein